MCSTETSVDEGGETMKWTFGTFLGMWPESEENTDEHGQAQADRDDRTIEEEPVGWSIAFFLGMVVMVILFLAAGSLR